MYKYFTEGRYAYEFGRIFGRDIIDEDSFVGITKTNENGFESHLSFTMEGMDLIVEVVGANNFNQIVIDRSCPLFDILSILAEQEFCSHSTAPLTNYNPYVRSEEDKKILFHAEWIKDRDELFFEIVNKGTSSRAVAFNLCNQAQRNDDYVKRLYQAYRRCYKTLGGMEAEKNTETDYKRD